MEPVEQAVPVNSPSQDKGIAQDMGRNKHIETSMRKMTFNLPFGNPVHFNPVTSIIGIVILWGLAIWCMVDPATSRAQLGAGQTAITDRFTWFYVGTNPFLMFFLLWVAYRYGDIKLGPQDAKPEFDDMSFFAMLWSAGIGVGLFVYGVSEPLWHQSSNWFTNQGYRTQDEVDMFALNLTVFHWGFSGWSQYLVVAICTGLACYRFRLPLTLRSCFYPLLGEFTWGWIGDIIDGITIVTTVAGVCTSLGLGTIQISSGLQRLGAVGDLTADEEERVRINSIWIITAIATVSVVTGLKVGIKYLSYLGFGLGMFLLVVTFLLDNPSYLMNLIVQEIGYYLQWGILQLNFHTDAFAQLEAGEGRATDGLSAHPSWMDWWTIFYIGWWVAWAAFVGLFIARISEGRTIRNVVMYTYIIPLAYTIVWFGVFGGVGLRQTRQAAELKQLGLDHFGDENKYVNAEFNYCYDVPQDCVKVDGSTVFKNTLPGVTPVCLFGSDGFSWYQVMYSFSYPDELKYGLGPFLSWVSLFALSIYFITSSDSGSLIVDVLAANGEVDAHWIQRVFWAVTEGAVATALLVAGGSTALGALQAASIIAGLPFSILLVLMCFSITRMCNLAETNTKNGTNYSLQEEYNHERVFRIPVFGGVFNVFEHIASAGVFVSPERKQMMFFPTLVMFIKFFEALLFPFLPLLRVYSFLNTKSSHKYINLLLTTSYAMVFYVGLVLFFVSVPGSVGIRALGWAFFFMAGSILSVVRHKTRLRLNIRGNFLADFILASLVWPQVLVQLEHEFKECIDPEDEEVKDVEA